MSIDTQTRTRTVSAFFQSVAMLPAAAILVAAPGLAGIFGDPSSPEQARRYLGQHRRDVALVCYSVAPDGTPDLSDSSIVLNADTPMPLASTIKIVLLAGYAREVSAGHLIPEQPVTVADWERFYLPATDGGAHPSALDELGILADEYGYARDGSTTVTLDQLVSAMIEHSDNAAADWILDRLGTPGWDATVAELGLVGQEPQLSILGQVLVWSNHENGIITPEQVSRYASDHPTYAADVARLQTAFQDPLWRDAELTWRLAGETGSTIWNELAPVGSLAPRGTAGDYARIMARVVTRTLISPAVSEVMQRHLEWPMQWPGMDETFTALGTKGGSLAGVLTEATYAIPKVGDFAGRPRVAVLFMRRMPVLAYLSMSRTGAQQLLSFRLHFDHAWVDKVRGTLGLPGHAASSDPGAPWSSRIDSRPLTP